MIYPSAQSGKRSDHGENVFVERILQFLWINAGGIARNHGENDPVADPDGLVVGHQVVHHIVTDPGDAEDRQRPFQRSSGTSRREEKHAEFGCVIDAARIDRPHAAPSVDEKAAPRLAEQPPQ
jgi:hypothetical protein